MLVKLIEIFQTPPNFVLLVVLVAIAQPAISTVTVAIALVTWPTAARLVRAEFRALREKDFVRAARGARLRPCAHHLARDPAQRAAAADRHRVGAGRDRDPDGVGAVVSRA